jgi:hypothetical protein
VLELCGRPMSASGIAAALHLHDALIELGMEGRRRVRVADELGIDSDVIGPRLLILLEEVNAMLKQLARYWERTRESGDPKTSPDKLGRLRRDDPRLGPRTNRGRSAGREVQCGRRASVGRVGELQARLDDLCLAPARSSARGRGSGRARPFPSGNVAARG